MKQEEALDTHTKDREQGRKRFLRTVLQESLDNSLVFQCPFVSSAHY